VSHSTYVPKPIDVSHVKLSDGILQLQEKLSQNAHEIWALQRLKDGWRYGPTRDDTRKEHPSLIPYDELSESEKTYDRNAVMESLKTIIALGYRIERS
jgi:RyR domain